MMTGMLKPEVKQQISFIKKNVVWPLLLSDGHKTPFIKVTVADFLWGYEDNLACITEPELKDSESETESDSDWDNEFWSEPEAEQKPGSSAPAKKKLKFVKNRNFRRPGVNVFKNFFLCPCLLK
jgi:hypothetical protein